MKREDTTYTALTPLSDLDDTQAVVDFIGDADVALPGEASHGTHEFYAYRAEVTKQLIVEGGFRAVVVEADWPDAYRVNRYVRHGGQKAARRARERYACFDRYGEDSQAYAYAETFGLESCEDAVVQQLVDLRQRGTAAAGDTLSRDEHFFAEQNGRLVMNAEEYYRTMFRGGARSWNLRDRHMTGTLQALSDHLSEPKRTARMAIWAHNSHLGDARATQMGQRGELNVGQLVREQFPGRACLIGFTTSQGTVTAASDWCEPVELKRVRPALPDSYEHGFHEIGVPRFFLPLDDDPTRRALARPQLERAIGVIYRPDTERQSHYFEASLAAQFDGVVHFDHTTALRPLEITPEWSTAEVPETYPTGV